MRSSFLKRLTTFQSGFAADFQSKVTGKPFSKIKFLFLAGFSIFIALFPKNSYSQSASPNRQIIIEKIDIIGNHKTSEEVIYRYLTVREGDPIDPNVIDLNDLRLSQTNFFKDVDFFTRPGSEKGKVIRFVEIEERTWPYFQFEGGHSDLDGWYFVPASLRLDNYFGQGSNLGLRLRIGDRISKISLWYRNEHIIHNSAFIDAELFAGGQNFVHYFGDERAEQDVGFGGLRFKIGGTKRLFKYLFFGFRAGSHNPENFATADDGSRIAVDDLPLDIADDLEKTDISVLSLGLNADLRDNSAYPLTGFWGALIGEISREGLFDSEADFSKITLDARFYQKLFGKEVFAFHFKGGYATEGTPFYERFYLGGANSLRGFDDRRLTPEGWGTRLILTNTEFRFPLTTKNFPYHKSSGVLFFDAGGIWLPGQAPDLDDFFTSFGIGFRIKLPVVGVTRFDFSFPVNKIDDNAFKFHISLGHTF